MATNDIHSHRLLILDFGSQYTQLIARRIRELGVYCEIMPFDVEPQAIKNFEPKGIILSGGPDSAYAADLNGDLAEVALALAVPILGICYGMQVLAHYFGGQVEACAKREFGYAKVQIHKDSPLLTGCPEQLDVWMSHGDQVSKPPQGFAAVASSGNAPVAIMADHDRQYYGVQFHPEVTHTEFGLTILQNFCFAICHCQANWTPGNIVDDSIAAIRAKVGKQKVLLGLSGGVDSSVVAAMLHQAIGDQLICVFVDTGLLRWHEGDEVMATFAQHLGINIIRVDAQQEYMQALAGVSDPEAKRRIIGNLFIDIFDRQAEQLTQISWLAQGTIYPDVVESAATKTGKGAVIKSHHNVGGLPEKMNLKLLEPLRELFKDEVRKIGVQLGLPKHMVYRHPFPGPGLGVRILGEVKLKYAQILRHADAIFIEELRHFDWYDKVSQAFAVFLPVKSVGVAGDQRRYDYVIALRAVETIDFMTAKWARLPYELIETVSHRIVNEVDHVSRVVYDVTGKPPGTIEWE